jgi:hypothetical protein
VLLEACAPASEFGTEWPADLPAQIHSRHRPAAPRAGGTTGRSPTERTALSSADEGGHSSRSWAGGGGSRAR